MRIYQAEKNDGIDFKMNKAGSSTAFVTAKVKICDPEKYCNMSVADLAQATSTIQTVEELLGQEQPDLALVVAILVSTGWNLNDDIFTPVEVWKARSSPLHKPMNDNHNAEKIIGHIVKSRVLDKEGIEIELTEDDALPNEFDIEVAGVLYRAFPELSDRIDEIIAKANAGEMFVSMEAWFPDFGYGLIDPKTGETKLIARNEETAFLTKHLRTYGGSGQYRGFRVGRVLKNIVFGAQGFVDIPANPESVIKVAAEKVAASRVFATAELSELLEGGIENVDEKQLKELQDKLAEAQASLENKQKEVAELQGAAKEFMDKDYDGQIVALTEKVDGLTVSVTEASEKIESAEAANKELQKQFDEAIKRAEKSEAEVSEIRKNESARERLVKLSEVKAIEDEEATLAELREMSDETFGVVLKYAGEVKSEDVVDESKEDKTKATNTEDDSKTDKEDAEEIAKAALDNVEEDDSADFNANESIAKSEADQWMSTAKALCGREDKKE